ncbi:MAG: PQQ-binding-like beta-propeller repeat protein [Caldisericia bacterium]
MKKFIIFALVLALIVPMLSASALTKTEWPNMLNDPAHTNYQPNANIPDSMQRNWVYYLDNGSTLSHVAVGDNIYFASSTGDIICLNQETGEEIWKYELGVRGTGSVGVSKGKLCFMFLVSNREPVEEGGGPGSGGGRPGGGGGGGRAHPMNSFNPFIATEEKTNAIIGMLSLEDGSELYKEDIVSPASITGGLISDDYVYLTYSTSDPSATETGPSKLVCMNPEDMSEVWSTDYDLTISSIITKGDGKLFTSAMKAKIDIANPMNSKILESKIVAFTEDGEIAWEKDLEKNESIGMISYANGALYHALMIIPENTEGVGMRQMPTSYIVARNADNGEEKWRFCLKGIKHNDEEITEVAFYGPPAITSTGLIVQGAINHTLCLSFDGNLRWVNETPGGMAFTGMQFSCTKDKVISARGSKFTIAKGSTGEILFVDDMKMSGGGLGAMMSGRMIVPIPIIANDKVFVCGDRIICYGEKIIGLYADPSNVTLDIYPDEEKSRKLRVFYNDTGEINGTLEAKADWIKLSSTEYKTISQVYDVTLSSAGLEVGKYESTIEVKSTVGDLSIPVTMNVVPKPPIKLEINLDDETITNQNPFPVDGVTKPGATLTANGRPIQVKSDGAFSDEIPIKEGTNELKFHAEDGDGNIADITKIVVLDDKKPTIRVSIADGQKVLSLPYEFYGSTEPGSKLLVNDEPVEVKSNGEFTVVIDGVENGEYVVEMVAKDVAGNTFKLERTITIDAAALELELTLPMPGYDGSNQTTYKLKGKSTPSVYIIASIDGQPIGQGMAGADGTFEIDLTLEGDGQYKVSVIARDMQSGKMSNPVEFMLLIDSIPPVLELEEIPEIVYGNSVTIEGSVAEDGVIRVTINDRPVTIEKDGTFASVIKLEKGINSLEIVATDMLGNKTVISKYIKSVDEIETTRLKLWVNTAKFVINNKQVDDLDPMPTTKSPPLPEALAGNSYMPVRAIFEALGATVGWDGNERS